MKRTQYKQNEDFSTGGEPGTEEWRESERFPREKYLPAFPLLIMDLFI